MSEETPATPAPVQETPPNKFMFDGSWRELKYDFETLAKFEELTGINAMNGAILKRGTASAKIIPIMLWCGMIINEPEIQLQHVIKKLKPYEAIKAWEACIAGYLMALEDPAEKKTQ